ncbi:hypothetical protein E9993_07740 [Labilibacter sediminis]|nr:hypothetical protein E9993_07740 [Labilibacter sediminis]
MLKSTVLTLLLILSVSSHSQNRPSSEYLYSLFQLDFTEAELKIEQIKDTPTKAYLQHYHLFFLIMINEDDIIDYNKRFKPLSNQILNSSDTFSNKWAYLAEIHIQNGILNYIKDNKWSALTAFSKAHSYWKKSESQHPALGQNLKLKGIFNLLIGNLPSPYAQWAGWFGFSGDTNLGFDALEEYLQQQNTDGFYLEAQLFLGYAYLKFSGREDIITDFIQASQNCSSPLIQSILIRCAFKIKSPQLCTKWLSAETKSNYPPLQYLKGKYSTFIFNANTPQVFEHFFNIHKGNQFKADAHRYLSWHYLLSNDTNAYLKHQDALQRLNNYPTWEDKQAQKESIHGEIPNALLLKSRILFDKGDYQLSANILLQIEAQLNNSEQQKEELYYRLGRCYQLQGNTTLAEQNYLASIKNATFSKRYYGPYSAIYAAKICINNNQTDKAKTYLNKARQLNNGEYKSQIDKLINIHNSSTTQH